MFQHFVNLTQSNSGTSGLMVYPERDPGKHYNEDGGQVGLKDKVTNVTLELEAE